MMRSLFWVSVVLVIYPQVIYPQIIAVLGLVRPRRVQRRAFTPTVSILIPAFNEADCIGATIENKLSQDYPADLLQIICVSDASDDGTDSIVQSFAARGVELLRREERQGKAAGLNAAVLRARGEILVFSDANAQFAPDAVRRLVENFADPDVGYVTGSLSHRHSSGNRSGEGVSGYMRFENWLRTLESRAGSVIGVNGGVDAMRRADYEDVPHDQITDFVLPLRAIAAGRRAVYDPRAGSAEDTNEDLGSEFRMRVRVALRALRGLSYMRRVLNPLRHPLASFCIFSHKILRYGAFVFMATALASNFVLAFRSKVYLVLFGLHLAVYALAWIGLGKRGSGLVSRICGLAGYFLISNLAFATATFRFLRGDAMATWRPRAG